MGIYLCVSLSILWLSFPVHAFNSLLHEQIIKSMFQYLNAQQKISPATKKWLNLGRSIDPQGQNQIERVLIRATVDVDYQPDLWMSSWYRSPFAGGQVKYLGMLTSLYHFLNVTKPGAFWEYDGYAYRHTDGIGNDSYLGMTGMKIRGDLSFPLGGRVYDDAQRRGVAYLGSYRDGFKGSEGDWQQFFFTGPAAKAVLPPSDIPAQRAYQLFLASKRALKNQLEEWDSLLPVAAGYVFLKKIKHHYWRQEIVGLPLALDSLGVTLHMLQDLGVPHHAQGLAGYCHLELEEIADELACDIGKKPDLIAYQTGYFDSILSPPCQKLYDPNLVTSILRSSARIKMQNKLEIRNILIEIAQKSAQWQFGKLDKQLMATRLPDGTFISGSNCDIFRQKKVFSQIKFQYNMAVAYSFFVFEKALQEWEDLNTAI
jgi:hypothetical protein